MAGRFDKSVGITLVGRDKSASKALENVGKKADGMGKKFQKAAGVAAKAIAAVAVAAGAAAIKIGMDSVKAASDLQETMSKTRELFGSAATAVEAFADKAATALGQSKTQALEAASQFAIFGKSAGLSGKQLVNFTTDLVTLASDLASFNNTSPEEAVLAIGAALRGENEPIRRYGVLINDAALKTQALKMGIIKSTKEALTPQQKVLAANKLIFQQTSSAQGDFARTSDGLANKQRILAAQFVDVKAKIGQDLLPVMERVVGYISDHVVPAIEALVDGFMGNDGLSVETDVATGHLKDLNNQALSPIQQSARQLGESMRELADAFSGIGKAAEDESSPGSGLIKLLKTLTAIVNAIESVMEWIGRMWKSFDNFAIGQSNLIANSANRVRGWFGLDPVPTLPARAVGGTVMSGGSYLVGERGPELLRMGSSGGRIIPNHQLGGGMTVQVVVQGSVIAEKDLARSVRDEIAQLMRRQGANPAVLGVGR